MPPLDPQQATARTWFEHLRDLICAEFTAIEREAGSDAAFDYIAWDRSDPSGEPGGGGVRGVMKGRVFEKVGVNVSTVGGTFEGEFAKSIHGAGEDPGFFATGISLVAHMANPHVPAVHMNCRFLVTTKRWFGGGADLNPPIPIAADTAAFHDALRAACDAHPPGDYDRFKAWADDYFYIPHRKVHRGVGGIFYDHLEGDFETNFAFTQDVGRAFLASYPAIVRRRMGAAFTADDIAARNEWRGRYAEFNLVYDRGTSFGLKTGGNVDAILMSLPPWRRGPDRAMVLIPVAEDEVATIVTTLEMRVRPPLRPIPASPLRLVHWPAAATDAYRTLFKRVGAPWLWYSRLAMDDARLAATIAEPTRRVFAVADARGIEVGMLELDFRLGDMADIAYFALVPELARQGHGRWLMAQALAFAWAPAVLCVRVRTCTLDHPSALNFYRAQGFVATERTIETFADPRALGLLPRDAAPQIPYLASLR